MGDHFSASFQFPTTKKSMLSPLGYNPFRTRSGLGLRLAMMLAVTFVVIGPSGTCFGLITQVNNDWHTGKRLDRFNQTSVSGSWTDTPIRDALNSFSKSQKVGLFLDRRIDPSKLVNIAASNISPEGFLWQIAESQQIGVCRVADLYFFGPPKTAACLPTIWGQMESQSGRQRRTFEVQWEKKSPLRTSSVVVVKQLLEQLATEHQFKIENPEVIPHDVWAQFELPPTSLAGRVGIVLAGFDKWFERSKDGKSIRIIDFPKIEIASLKIESLADPRATSEEMKLEFPELKITGTSKRLTASGPPLQIARLRRALIKSQSVEAAAPDAIRFKLNTQAPRGSILATVAHQLNKKLKFSPEIQQMMQAEIQIQIKDATLNQLLDETLKGTELKYELTDTELVISAK